MTVPATLLCGSRAASRPLLFMRHGATQPNLDGLRCGGDLDLPLTETGRAQVAIAAQALRDAGWRIDAIVASDLDRTRESAQIAGQVLGGVPIRIEPAWRERRLGRWNLRPITENAAAMAAGVAPPGGEAAHAFGARIEGALRQLAAALAPGTLPLLVGSKGVARVLGDLLGAPPAAPVANGGLLCFDLARWRGPHERTEAAVLTHGALP
jgi:2,3-bisphosphoglycerate-dependent phosphoglycerate mutase